MIISKDVWGQSVGVELVRNGNDVTLNLAGSADGYYDPDLGYWEWYGYMEATFGDAFDYVEQYYDRPMDLSVTETLSAGTTTKGTYYVEGDPSASVTFSAILFDTATTYAGTAGVDYIFGSALDDKLSSSAGDDGIDGGGGNDWLNGGKGADHLEGGAGSDTASYTGATSAVVARLYNGLLGDGDAAGDRYVSIENLEGSFYGDHLYGDDLGNTLWGREGADTLFGRKGSDLLVGGKGADLLFGESGQDTASYADASSAVIASLMTGSGSLGDALGDEYTSIEALTGSQFDDALTGNADANTLRGGSGGDNLRGLAGSDTLLGGGGDDLLAGGGGGDLLNGGFGQDTASYADAAAGVIANLSDPGANLRDAFGDTYLSIENLTGTGFNDTLTGNTQENVIIGGLGNDIINGGGAIDRLRGGTGFDTFVFDTALNTGSNTDIIFDYLVAEDRIRLDDAVFTALSGPGPLGAAAFTIGSAATTAAHRIIYNDVTGALLYDADGDASGEAISFARLSAGLSMTAAEFLIV